ncbi:MAG: ABC-type transport system involved in resitance to organic solvent, permease protein [Phycisphaerales bacterium]|nr:ABC-type transport system involved in resitance to organic solvent, permease protein [Phycisphaerales bacterium]
MTGASGRAKSGGFLTPESYARGLWRAGRGTTARSPRVARLDAARFGRHNGPRSPAGLIDSAPDVPPLRLSFTPEYETRMTFIRWLGTWAVAAVGRWVYLTGVVYAVVVLAANPRTWHRTVREVLARQVLFTGVEAVRLTAAVAFFVGAAVVVQAQVWLLRLGQAAAVGPLLAAVVVREVGPLLANVIVVVRSGNAIAVELANMKTHGEVRVLDAQGLDPLVYLVVPRAVGLTVSVSCLTVLLSVIALAAGYLLGLGVGARVGTPAVFTGEIVKAIGPWDVATVATKAVVPSLLAGVICCTEGLGVGGAATDIPRAVTRAVQRSFVSLFVTSGLITVATYVY